MVTDSLTDDLQSMSYIQTTNSST